GSNVLAYDAEPVRKSSWEVPRAMLASWAPNSSALSDEGVGIEWAVGEAVDTSEWKTEGFADVEGCCRGGVVSGFGRVGSAVIAADSSTDPREMSRRATTIVSKAATAASPAATIQ